MKYKAILLFGAPGSGKGTQGKAVGCIPGFIHTSTGDMFRALDPNSEMGKTAAGYAQRGELVPDEFTINLWTQTMEKWIASGKFNSETDILVMDGVPRNVKQAELLKDKIDVLKVLYLEVSDIAKMVERLKKRAIKEGRKDDADENVIRNRMEIYDRETAPVLGFYAKRKVAKVDALLTPAEVLNQITRILIRLTSPKKEAAPACGGDCCCQESA
jgi:adenylate kinase